MAKRTKPHVGHLIEDIFEHLLEWDVKAWKFPKNGTKDGAVNDWRLNSETSGTRRVLSIVSVADGAAAKFSREPHSYLGIFRLRQLRDLKMNQPVEIDSYRP